MTVIPIIDRSGSGSSYGRTAAAFSDQGAAMLGCE
jgi:hypothetical protein